MSSSMSLRELRKRRKRDVFVGRRQEVEFFKHMIDEGPSLATPVLNIVGVGGIGKSALLRQYMGICKDRNVPYALVDGRDERIKVGIVAGRVICNLPEILKIWRDQLVQTTQDEAFQEFDKDIKRFEGIVQKYWRSEKAERRSLLMMESFAAETAGGLIGASIAGAPGAVLGAAVGTLAGSLVNAIGRTVPRLASAGLDKTEVDFCFHIERNLANSFSLGVNRVVENRGRVVIMIDTFEMIQSFQEWILNLLFDTDISAEVRFVIAGRAPLDSSRWHDWLYLLKTIQLEPLQPEDVSEFLGRHEIRDNLLVKRAQQITEGVPWALTLLAENLEVMEGDWQELVEQRLRYEICREMVDRFLDQIKDEDERLVIEACAVPLSFDADLIETMLHSQFPGSAVWRKATQHSFFGTLPSGRIFMTDPIREFIVDRLSIVRPLTLDKWNDRAREYYRQILGSSEKQLVGYIWEYLYHYFFTDLEARSIFLPRREFMDRLEVSIPPLGDARRILEVDRLTMGSDSEILYSLERIESYLKRDPAMFRIAVDKESGRVAGYALVMAPDNEWCRKFEAKEHPRLHLYEPKRLDEIGEFGDYLIDTIAVIDPSDRITAAMLIRGILPVLTVRPRKFYGLVVSEYGLLFVQKLQLNYLTTRYTTDGSPIQCFYFCMYSGQRNSPLYEALEKYRPDVPMQVACRGCAIEDCPYFSQYAKGDLVEISDIQGKEKPRKRHGSLSPVE